jgi:hypothetical protein
VTGDVPANGNSSWWRASLLEVAEPVLRSDDIQQALAQAEVSTDVLRGMIAEHAEQLASVRTSSFLAFAGRIRWNALLSSRGIRASGGLFLCALAAIVAAGLLCPLPVAVALLFGWAAAMFAFCFYSVSLFRGPVRPSRDTGKILRDEVVGPFVREKLNQLLDEHDYEPVLRVRRAPALAALIDSEQLCVTPAMAEFGRLAGDMAAGVIGVSGPRGAGKTTLLRYFSDPSFQGFAPDRRMRIGSHDLRFVVAAPVRYEPREFVLHVFSRLCDEVRRSVPALRREARAWQRKIRYLHSFNAGFSLGLPRGLPLSVTYGRQLSEVPITLPELIEAMRTFAEQVISRLEDDLRRSHEGLVRLERKRTSLERPLFPATFLSRLLVTFTGGPPSLVPRSRWPGPRLVIGIDELDKMEPDSAGSFVNEIKAIFGMPSCLFLVSVSDEALMMFRQRMVLGRTAFDSAFDEVIRVDPLEFDACRSLLRHRIAGLPDSLVAFCQVMSGGIPRDMIRVARSVLDCRARGREEIPAIIQDLVDTQAKAIRQASRAPASEASPAGMPVFRTALYFYDTVAEVFGVRLSETVKLLRARDIAAATRIDRLASAWSIMSVNPPLAREMIDHYRAARGLSIPDESPPDSPDPA